MNITTESPHNTTDHIIKHHVEEKQSAILFFIFSCCAVGGMFFPFYDSYIFDNI